MTLENYIKIPSTSTKLKPDFFARSAEEVARNIIGKILVRNFPNETQVYGAIREVAAYEGKTKTSYKSINYRPGRIGISRKFGQYLLDIATGEVDKPSCITIRGIYVPTEKEINLINGPGNITKEFKIDGTFDGASIDNAFLWVGGNSLSQTQVLERSLSRQPKNCQGIFYSKKW